jgi:hypothetical protein
MTATETGREFLRLITGMPILLAVLAVLNSAANRQTARPARPDLAPA